jgi:hypothetical protein
MKLISALLLVYLSSLMIAPAFVQLMPCAENICTRDCKENSQKSSDDCNKNKEADCAFGICCNNCLFNYTEEEHLRFIPTSVSEEKKISADENGISFYSADCWHPPEKMF